MKSLKKTLLLLSNNSYSRLEEAELFNILLNCNSSTRHEIINYLLSTNIDYIIAIANKYKHLGLLLEDLVSEGCIGLIKAIDKFSKKTNCKFRTYATFWIKQQIMRTIDNCGKTIRIPINSNYQIKEYKQILISLKNKLGRVPTIEELSVKMELSVKSITRLMKGDIKVYSVENKINNRETISIGDISLIDYKAPDTKLIKKDYNDFLQKQLKTLTKREAKIIDLRYGFNEKEPKSLANVSEIIGLSIERTRQIEILSIKKLKNLLKKSS